MQDHARERDDSGTTASVARPDPRRRALGVGLVAAAVVLAVVYVILPWGEACQPCYLDFWYYLSAAHTLRDGQNPYDVEAVKAHWVGVPLPFYWITYPPYFLAALQPLTWVPPRMAERIWTLVTMATLAGISVLLLGILRVRLTPVRLGLALLFTLSYLPTLAVLNLGQATALLVAAGYLAWWLLQRGHPRTAGLALALLTIKPHWLLTPGLYLAVRRDWRALGALGIGAAVLLLPGWSLLLSWYGGMRDMATHHQLERGWANPSPLNLLGHLGLGTPELRLALAAGLSVILLGGFVLLTWRTAEKSGGLVLPQDDMVMALGWVLLPLALPQFRAYDLMVLLAPLLVIGRVHWLQGGFISKVGLGLVGLAWGWPYVQLLAGSLRLGLYNEWVWYVISPLALLVAGLLALRHQQGQGAGPWTPERAPVREHGAV